MKERSWYDSSPQQTELLLNTGIFTGLTRTEARKRLAHYGPNTVYPAPQNSFRKQLRSIAADPSKWLLVVAAILAAIFDQMVGAALLVSLALINLALGLLTFRWAQKLLESNARQALPTARVMRESRVFLTPGENLVPGDIIYVAKGDIVPADARLVECDDFTVLELPLTGAARSVRKDPLFTSHRNLPPADQKCMIFAGTIVTGGSAKAIVCRTGGDTALVMEDKTTPITTHEQLPVFGLLKRYCSVWSLTGLGLIALLTVFYLFFDRSGKGLYEIFLTGLTLAAATMSELYNAFGSIIVACGVLGATNRRKSILTGAILKNPAKLEQLRDLSALVVPKESLLAVRGASIRSIYAGNTMENAADKSLSKASAAVLRYAVISTGLYGSARLMSKNAHRDNSYSPDEEMLLRSAEQLGIYNRKLEERYPLLEHRPAGPHNRFDTSLVLLEGGFFVVVRGEAQQLLSCCTTYSQNGKVYPLSPEKLEDLRLVASKATRETCRVVAVATRSTTYNTLTRIVTCQSELNFEGFLCIREPLLPDAAKNIAACQKAGIKVIMTTDDTGDNNRYLAAALGIVSEERHIVTGSDYNALRPDMQTVNAPLYRLYQGVTCADKHRIVECLQACGEKVGVIVRSLDEITLLRQADIGFSQSASVSLRGEDGVEVVESVPSASDMENSSGNGCEAVKFLSDVILSLPGNDGSGGFNSAFSAITSARVIYFNLLRALRYLLTTQSARFLLVIWSIFSASVQLTPVQILFTGLIMDFAAVFIIAFEKPGTDVLSARIETEQKLHHPLRHNLESIGFGLLWAGISVGIPAALNAMELPIRSAAIPGAVFAAFLLTQLAVLAEYKKERSAFHDVRFNLFQTICGGMFALFFLSGILFAPLGSFSFASPTLAISLFVALTPLILIGAMELYKKLCGGSLTKDRSLALEAVENVKSVLVSGFTLDSLTRMEEEEEEKQLAATAHFTVVHAPAPATEEKSAEAATPAPEAAPSAEAPAPEEPDTPTPDDGFIDKAVDTLLDDLDQALRKDDDTQPSFAPPSELDEHDPFLDELKKLRKKNPPEPAPKESTDTPSDAEKPSEKTPRKPPMEETILVKPGDLDAVLRQLTVGMKKNDGSK